MHEHKFSHDSINSFEESIALLKYLASHNASHAYEVEHILKSIENAEAKKHINDAVEQYKKGNDLLEKAIEILEK